jgi:hypothetical protein
MSAEAKVEMRGDVEVHVSNRGDPDFEEHEPQWGPATLEYFNAWLRQCLHPHCDVDTYTTERA